MINKVWTLKYVLCNYSFNIFPCLGDGFCAEDNPAEDDEEEGKENLEGFAESGKETSFGDLVGVFAVHAEEDEWQEEDCVVRAPSDKRPISAMPKAGEQENDESVADYFPFDNTTTTERNIDIISEPCCKGDVPFPPKLRYVTREIGIVEVTHQFDTKEFGSTDGNVRIAGEVTVDLECKEYGSKKQSTTCLSVVGCPNLIHISRAVVSDYYLFEQAPQDLAHSVHSLVVIELAVGLELRQEVGCAFYRACNKLREECYVRKEGNDVARGFYLLTIHINGITERLECIE